MKNRKTLKVDELPIKFRQLVVFFDVINDVFCFLKHRDIVPTVAALESVFKTFELSVNSSSACNVAFSIETLLLIQSLDPKHIKVESKNVDSYRGNHQL